ncbi:DUF2235 domain-containing protein [Archangium gephyra]|nr:DUF2235 domain-containing protein [Archangium gephyra]
MATNNEPNKLQSPGVLCRSASLAGKSADKTGQVPAATSHASSKDSSVPVPQGIRIAFFFDGTGNNLDADVGNDEHSNVARLFRAHHRDDPTQGVFRYYIPGIGTRFKEVGDTGGETLGLAFGGKGQARLDWAMRKFEERVAQSKGRTICLALFGFSRGSALARAFARMVAERCKRASDGLWHFTHNQRRHHIRIYFMGLFDSVASVGAPMGTNNAQSIDLTSGVMNLAQVLQSRHAYGSTLDELAFAEGGAPGADPAPGMANGHMSWADDLRIPEMVEDCLHMVAAHEIRNSFPLDSVLDGSRYPKSCREMVYPGAHSDVGGGYRQGEGARSPSPGSSLSLVPLRAMRAEAIRAGVPLMAQMPSVNLKRDFGEDPACQGALMTLDRRFKLYMDGVGWGGKSVGEMMLAHMKVYYQWRFYRLATRVPGKPTPEQILLQSLEPGWAKEQNRLKSATDSLQRESNAHRMMAGQLAQSGALMFGAGAKRYEQESKLAVQKQDEYLAQKAILDALPSSDGSFARNSAIYDNQLLLDALKLQALAKKKGRNKLRPHYKAVLEAYEAEFERGQGLRNREIIAFFDTYVHDSLAGFATDATLPSDPRVIYMGGDDKLKYAMNQPGGRGSLATALG